MRPVCACLGPMLVFAAGARAGNQLVQIDEAMAGANGDSRVAFVELKICCPGQNQWGPQGAEFGGRARLMFYDAAGRETGELVFPGDPPDQSSAGVPDGLGAVSVLVATQTFANLPGMPSPDFILPDDLLMAGGGKICYADNSVVNPNAEPVRLCLSYGDFAGITGTDLGNPPCPAGPPAAALPTTNAGSLVRFQHFDRFGTQQDNADFHLAPPAPRNSAGQTAAIAPAPVVTQGQNLFFLERFQGNGRTCLSCHQPQDAFGLSPATIGSLPDDDPVFISDHILDLALLENACLLRSRRALILENIDGFDHPPVYRGSPHLLNIALTAPYGQSGEFADLRSFSAGAVRQHFPRSLARNADPAAGPIDFREPTQAELAALETFMNAIVEPADGNFNVDRMILAAAARGADASAIIRGRSAFNGNAKCFLCHSGPVMADVHQSMIDDGLVTPLPGGSRNLPFDTGVVRLPVNDDAEVRACLGAPMPPEAGGHRTFSTPPLLGVAGTGPFFHDHSALTLREVVEFYNRPEFNQSPAGQLIGGIAMSPGQFDDIVAFLEALRDPSFQIGPPVMLVVDPIAPQIVGTPFDVAVRSTDVNHNPSPVSQDTAIAITLRTATGFLGGTLTGTLPANASSITFSGLTYSTSEAEVGLTAARTSGLVLAPGNSNQFVVCLAPPVLALASPNGGETIPAGSAHLITWTAAGDLGELAIDLWQGDVLVRRLGTAPAEAGSFWWDVCAFDAHASDYRIRLRQTNCHCVGCITDFSDLPFTLSQPAVPGSGRGDLDGDCDVDAADLDLLTACNSRANVPHDGTPACQAADLDGDGDVDPDDFGLFQRRYRPGLPVN